MLYIKAFKLKPLLKLLRLKIWFIFNIKHAKKNDKNINYIFDQSKYW